eukprot:tig00020734_g13596.t1
MRLRRSAGKCGNSALIDARSLARIDWGGLRLALAASVTEEVGDEGRPVEKAPETSRTGSSGRGLTRLEAGSGHAPRASSPQPPDRSSELRHSRTVTPRAGAAGPSDARPAGVDVTAPGSPGPSAPTPPPGRPRAASHPSITLHYEPLLDDAAADGDSAGGPAPPVAPPDSEITLANQTESGGGPARRDPPRRRPARRPSLPIPAAPLSATAPRPASPQRSAPYPPRFFPLPPPTSRQVGVGDAYFGRCRLRSVSRRLRSAVAALEWGALDARADLRLGGRGGPGCVPALLRLASAGAFRGARSLRLALALDRSAAAPARALHRAAAAARDLAACLAALPAPPARAALAVGSWPAPAEQRAAGVPGPWVGPWSALASLLAALAPAPLSDLELTVAGPAGGPAPPFPWGPCLAPFPSLLRFSLSCTPDEAAAAAEALAAACPALRSLRLPSLPPAAAEAALRLPLLEALEAGPEGPPLAAPAARALAGHPSLRRLALGPGADSPDALAALALAPVSLFSSLEHLEISLDQESAAGVAALGRLPRLASLALGLIFSPRAGLPPGRPAPAAPAERAARFRRQLDAHAEARTPPPPPPPPSLTPRAAAAGRRRGGRGAPALRAVEVDLYPRGAPQDGAALAALAAAAGGRLRAWRYRERAGGPPSAAETAALAAAAVAGAAAAARGGPSTFASGTRPAAPSPSPAPPRTQARSPRPSRAAAARLAALLPAFAAVVSQRAPRALGLIPPASPGPLPPLAELGPAA